jgi:hypothetical protein
VKLVIRKASFAPKSGDADARVTVRMSSTEPDRGINVSGSLRDPIKPVDVNLNGTGPNTPFAAMRLVNGCFEATAPLRDTQSQQLTFSYAWTRDDQLPASISPLAVLLNLSDETGLPVALEVKKEIPLEFTTRQIDRDADALTASTARSDSQGQEPLSLRGKLLRLRWDVSRGSWATNGTGELLHVPTNGSPLELHGFADNTWLELTDSQAELVIGSVWGSSAVVHSLLSLRIPDGKATLQSILDEEDYAGELFGLAPRAEDTRTLVRPDQVRSRVATRAFRLPINSPALLESGATRDFASAVRKWRHEIDEELVKAFPELNKPSGTSLHAAAGFQRQPAAKMTVASVLGEMPASGPANKDGRLRVRTADELRLGRPIVVAKRDADQKGATDESRPTALLRAALNWLVQTASADTPPKEYGADTFKFGVVDAKGTVKQAATELREAIKKLVHRYEELVLGRPGSASLDASDVGALRDRLLRQARRIEGSVAPSPEFVRLMRLSKATADELKGLVQQLAKVSQLTDGETFSGWWGKAAQATKENVRTALGKAQQDSLLAAQDLMAALQRAAWWWMQNGLDLTATLDGISTELDKMPRADASIDVWVEAARKKGWPPTYFGPTTSKKLPDAFNGILMSKAPDLGLLLRMVDEIDAEVTALKAKATAASGEARTQFEWLKTSFETLRREFKELERTKERTKPESLLRAAGVPAVEWPVWLGQDQQLRDLRRQWDTGSDHLIEKAKGNLKHLENATREQLEKDLNELLRRNVGLDDVALEEIRRLRKEARTELGRAMGLGERGERVLRELRGFTPAYVAAGRGIVMGIDADDTKKLAGARDELEQLTALVGRPLELCRVGGGGIWRFAGTDRTVFVLKLGKRMGLAAILDELHVRHKTDDLIDPLGLGLSRVKSDGPTPSKEWVEKYVDPVVQAEDWQGLILLNPQFDLDGDTVVRDVCGLSRIEAKYVAFAKPLGGETDTSGKAFDVWARASVAADEDARNPKSTLDLSETDAKITLLQFEVIVGRSRLSPDSRIDLRIDVGRLFGATKADASKANGKGSDDWARMVLVGRVLGAERPGEETRFGFATEFEKAQTFKIDKLVFDTLSVRGISAALRGGRTALEIDADLKLKALDDFKIDETTDAAMRLRDFRLVFPGADGGGAAGVPRAIRFDFGALQGTFKKPRALRMGLFELEIKEFGYVRRHADDTPDGDSGSAARAQLKRRFKPLKGDQYGTLDDVGELPYVVFGVTFGGLPGLDRSPEGRIRVDVLLGLNVAKGSPVVAAGNAAGSDIRFDLFRVLQVYLGTLLFEPNIVPTLPDATNKKNDRKPCSVLYVEDFRLAVLGWDLIGEQDSKGKSGATVLHLQNETGERGFGTYLKFKRDAGLVDLDWVFLGRNLELQKESYIRMLEGGAAPGDFVSEENMLVELKRDSDPPTLHELKADLAGHSAWVFGVHFRLMGKLLERCALLLQDGKFYGIQLRGELVKLFETEGDSSGGALTIAYQPGATPAADRFFVAMRMPALEMFNIGAGGFSSGLVSLGWSFNADALVSLGFPVREGTRYRWDDSFGCYQGIYQAHFGFYAEKRSGTLCVDEEGRVIEGDCEAGDKKFVQLRGGLGVEFGYGVMLGGGWLCVKAGIGVFVVVEGAITVLLPRDAKIDNPRAVLSGRLYKIEVNGVIGLIAYVEGYISIWIISARFRAELQAALACKLTWTQGQPLVAAYDATVYAGYYARACINCGVTKICKSVSGKYPIKISGAVTL